MNKAGLKPVLSVNSGCPAEHPEQQEFISNTLKMNKAGLKPVLSVNSGCPAEHPEQQEYLLAKQCGFETRIISKFGMPCGTSRTAGLGVIINLSKYIKYTQEMIKLS